MASSYESEGQENVGTLLKTQLTLSNKTVCEEHDVKIQTGRSQL